MLPTRISASWARMASIFAICTAVAIAQGSYRAQLRGVITDASGALVAHATITITDAGTNISSSSTTDDKGAYYFTGLRPSTYSVKITASGFRATERTGLVLAVDQETTLNAVMTPAGVSEQIDVSTAAPLLDTESSTLGTDITNEYVKNIPLLNRSFFGLAFLSGGVTEAAGSGTQDNYPSGTNFVSNGQRNATAEVRLDGSLISAPEQGEGATSNVYYEPSVEIIQEFKVENNSFSAEFGNNGGTVVNMVLKSGTNALHGSGWYFLQRAGTDARDFFNPEPNGKPNHLRDQYGFALGGPIRKNKTFFFVDFEKVRDNEPINIVASVPTNGMFGTSNERAGDFSGAANPIFDPISCSPNCSTRTQVQSNGVLNVIPSSEIDAIGQAILNQYPQPNLPGEFNNYRLSTLSHSPGYQFDIKLDHQISDKHRINGRYSRLHNNATTPLGLGDGSDNTGDNGGIANAPLNVQNAALEYTWTLNPRIIWTNHFAVDRAAQRATSGLPTLESANLPAVLNANGIDRMPTIQISGNSAWSSLYDQCCINTTFAHTLYSYSSQLVISKGPHLMKLGGEQRIFFNNFFQPPYPTGLLNFTDDVTSDMPNTNAEGGTQGNPFASVLFGYPDNGSVINVYPGVSTKSKETGFYFQDDWKVNSKLTVNLGLRYEWSTPYTERSNRVQFSDFSGSSGMSIDLTSGGQTQALGLGTLALNGITLFAKSGMRSVPVDRNNFGPRLGFAYQLDSNTVIRGGAGVYYGMNVATNFQYPGTAFRKSATMFFTLDNFNSRSASLANPFPGGLTGPQGTQYGKLADWGYLNQNDLGTSPAQNADIYQWNLGIQRLLPSQIVIGVDYSANRSTHLPWGGYSSTRNRNFISSSLLAQTSIQQHALDPTCDADSCVSNYLANPVANPFCSLFSGVGCTYSAGPAIFNEPDSRYGQTTIPLINLLRPYPQFDANFEGLPLLEASSWYNSLQIRFQKRTTHHISFEGSYTFSKLTDDSSVGANAFVGTLNNGNPQQLDNLRAEHGISANDTPQRLAAAIIVELPIGRQQWIGGNMNRIADAVVGGWSISSIITAQSGQPLSIPVANGGRLIDGNQRPNVLCGGSTGISSNRAAITQMPILDANCFADPGDQVPGDGPRYFSHLRTDGIHSVDMSLYKEFTPKESMKVQLRVDVFNSFNHPRFGLPNTAYSPGDQTFGVISSTAAGFTPRRLQYGIRFEF